MALSATDETNFLKLLLQNVAWAGVGDTNGPQPSASAGSFYLALFTADPGPSGSFANEVGYTGYARQALARSTAAWGVSGSSPAIGTNVNSVTFPNCTGTVGSPVTYCAIVTALTGGRIVASGPLTAPYQPAIGNAPVFSAGQISISST